MITRLRTITLAPLAALLLVSPFSGSALAAEASPRPKFLTSPQAESQSHSTASPGAAASKAIRWILPKGMTEADVKATRVIASSTAVAETIYALGAGEKLVAVDLAAAEVPQSKGLPNVGYETQLSPEGLLAQKPTLVIAGERIGPQTTIDQLTAAGVPVVVLGGGFTADAVAARIGAIAKLVGKEADGEKIIGGMRRDLAEAARLAANAMTKPRIMLLMSRGGGRLMAAGRETAADGLIALAGAQNAGADFSGYKPLTPESAVALKPDWLIVTSAGTSNADTIKELRADPALALTPAMKNGRVIVRPAAELLSFGPGLGKTVLELARSLYVRVDEKTGHATNAPTEPATH